MTTEKKEEKNEQVTFRVVEMEIADVKPVAEAWDNLTEDDRATVRSLAVQLRKSILKAGNVYGGDCSGLWDSVVESKIADIPPAAAEWLTTMKKHTWDDRTWAQRLMFVSLVPTLPLYAGKAAGLVMLGTGFRVAIPVVAAAAATLVGAGFDLVSSTFDNLNNRTTKVGEDQQNRITFHPQVHGGRPCIRGQFPIRDILDQLATGSSRRKILRTNAGLEDADITAALKFASGAMNHPIPVIDVD